MCTYASTGQASFLRGKRAFEEEAGKYLGAVSLSHLYLRLLFKIRPNNGKGNEVACGLLHFPQKYPWLESELARHFLHRS